MVARIFSMEALYGNAFHFQRDTPTKYHSWAAHLLSVVQQAVRNQTALCHHPRDNFSASQYSNHIQSTLILVEGLLSPEVWSSSIPDPWHSKSRNQKHRAHAERAHKGYTVHQPVRAEFYRYRETSRVHVTYCWDANFVDASLLTHKSFILLGTTYHTKKNQANEKIP